MMAGWMKSRRTLRLLVLFSLLTLTQQFEVREDEWEELRPDIAALHRLRGLPQRMFHERFRDLSNRSDSSSPGARVQRSSNRLDFDRDPMSLRDDLKECEKSFAACVIQMGKDLESFLAAVDDQKSQDWLLRASEISQSYSQKLLVMTDTEKSTNERVQQEYGLDPLHSVIVCRRCLSNASCVPEADSYTVVKIFGNVSEDGQTVSGLSGSSLAELMLKPALEAVPVFSLDGNTTTEFQHSFIRALVVRGIDTVLETSQENNQIYQVMNRRESVSGYKTSQKPVDPSTQYDHQQILIMENDPVVKKAAIYLYEKHPSVSSVYVLDENHRPKLIHGDAAPLTEESRLVLVGHGTRDDSGEMRLAGNRAQEVSKIIEQTYRVTDKIKTTSVVACNVGSDEAFVETLLKDLHDTSGIKTELHVRDAVLQVTHTGQKITQEISADGLQWTHKDDSKKVVATLDRNGDVIIREKSGSKGQAVFTNERNVLVNERARDRFLIYRDSWPDEPQRFIDPNVFQRIKKTNQNRFDEIRNTCDELEALSWGLFHKDLPPPERVNTENWEQTKGQYLIGERKRTGWNEHEITWIADETRQKQILSKCYEIKSGEDVRNIIRHYAKTGEDELTHLMLKDWIYAVDPENLYVYPVGKRLDSNQRGNEAKSDEVKKCITDQLGKEKYSDMKDQILNSNIREPKESYVKYMRGILLGEHTVFLPLSTEAWCNTYFTASVISESARNFRTFPLTLMALDTLDKVKDQNIRERALNFFFDDHSMARGMTWIDPSRRGFRGSATPEESSKLHNKERKYEWELMSSLEKVITKEVKQYKLWSKLNRENGLSQLLNTAEKYKITKSDSVESRTITNDYKTFKAKLRDRSGPPASGTLGGYNDGHIASHDLKSASGLENQFKLESYFSRTRALTAQQIHSEVKAKYGDSLAQLRLQEDGARVKDGQLICHLVPEGGEPAELRVPLSPESQHYNEKMLKSFDIEGQSSGSSHEVSTNVEHAGAVLGRMGLMLGMKGAVRAFEHGDIKDGVMGTLQTLHGVTSMTASAIAKQTLSSEARIAKTAAAVMKSPVMKGTMAVLPIVGIGFGLYNFEQDLERDSTLGYIDAALDASMVVLDVVELAQPELAPFIAPVNIVLSGIRMVSDDVYMGIENELNSLPKDAGVLEKLLAVPIGFVKGVVHFFIHVASFFYDWHQDEIEQGERLVAEISDYHKYYTITKENDGKKAMNFIGGDSSWNGGGIHFCLDDLGQAELCMDLFVSSDRSVTKKCWPIDTDGSTDIILGLGESHRLEYTTLQNKVLMFIPADTVTVVSGYEAVSDSRYGIYTGNRDANRFFAIQKAEDKHVLEIMLSYYYRLYGEPGDDIFFLGPQRSYVQGSGGKDTYIIPEHGGKTIINNYDLSKALDTLHFSVSYSQISVSKSGDDVVLMYEGSHTVTIEGWFLGELYRHMNIMSGDGVLFEISSTVVSSVQLVATGINKMFKTQGETVNASEPLLSTVTNIFGSRFDDLLIGNGEKNLIDGGGGHDHLMGGEGEDTYLVKDRNQSSVSIENYSRDSKTDLAIIEADLHTFTVRVEGDDVVLNASHNGTVVNVTLVRWFGSPADRHLLIVTKDLITFTVSDNKTDCQQSDPFAKCIQSRSIDYSTSPSALVVDLQEDEALDSVTEVRGSEFDDVIKGNKDHNVVVPGKGNDFIQGRAGEDWYVITPGQGVKTINNEAPDLALDLLFLKEEYKYITCTCEGQSIVILVRSRRDVILQNWFNSKNFQHLHIKTSDGITAGLRPERSSCGKSLLLPLIVDYRKQTPEALHSHLMFFSLHDGCFRYRSKGSEDMFFCNLQGKVMTMNDVDSVKEMYGSSGFDIMVGNSNENLLDPYTGGALMFGGEGKDTYIIKRGYGNNLMIDNFAEDHNIDTVLVDMDFFDGSQVALNSSAGDLDVTITTKGEQIQFSLLKYSSGYQHQHLEFKSSDGVNFKLKSLNSTGEDAVFYIQAFKVTLKQSQVDCRLDLSSHRNLSKVHTVQGCPLQSNDILGNDQDNALIGGWKDDTLEGGLGDDTLIGGNGNDVLVGNMGDDTLYGEDGNDTMMGNSGRDVFIPGPGADLVDGGSSRDTVLYRGDPDTGQGVYVNLMTGQGRYADAEGDVLKDVEMVVGSIYSDILVAGYESSLLMGSDGNDTLVSNGGDYLVGGDGNDIYMLAFHHGSVVINNCAKDNATDVLYLSSRTRPRFDYHVLSDRVVLTFFGQNQTAVKVALVGWTSDDNECGHLKVVFREVEVSVDWLLQRCQKRRSN